MLARLEEAERSGKPLTPKGQETLQRLRAARGEAPQQSLIGRAWEMAKIPQQVAGQVTGTLASAGQQVSPETQQVGYRAAKLLSPIPGVGAVADTANTFMNSQRAQPTGNLPMDIATALPRIAGETAAEYGPGYLSPESLLTMGALKGAQKVGPAAKRFAQGLGAQMENMVASPAGTLEKAAGNVTSAFRHGRKAAQPYYEAAKAKGTLPSLPGVVDDAVAWTPEEVAARHVEDVYMTAVAKAADNTLTPVEALEGRKAADAMLGMKKYAKDALHKGRKILSKIAKTDDNILKADELHEAGLKNEALRRILPQNKYGGTSAFKMGVMGAMNFIPGIGHVLAAQMSPLVQGAEAALGGLAVRRGLIPLIRSRRLAASAVAGMQGVGNGQ